MENYDDIVDLFSLNNIQSTVAQLSPSKKLFKPLKEMSLSVVNISNNTTRSNLKKTHTSLILRDSTPSSIHMSEFEQPPKSTSTPFLGSYIDMNSLVTSNKAQSLFRLQSEDDFEESCSNQVLHDTDESIVSSNLADDDPISYKRLYDDMNKETSFTADRINNAAIFSKTPGYSEYSADYLMADQSQSVVGLSSISMIDINDLKTSTPQRSILKGSPNAINNRVKDKIINKKVRIDEEVQLINEFTPEITRKRPISQQSFSSSYSSFSTPTTKKVRLKREVDKETSYAEFVSLCGNLRDPIDILLKRN